MQQQGSPGNEAISDGILSGNHQDLLLETCF